MTIAEAAERQREIIVQRWLATVIREQSAAISSVVADSVRDGCDEDETIAWLTKLYLDKRPRLEQQVRAVVAEHIIVNVSRDTQQRPA